MSIGLFRKNSATGEVRINALNTSVVRLSSYSRLSPNINLEWGCGIHGLLANRGLDTFFLYVTVTVMRDMRLL